MPRKLKVFRTAAGFHDAYVAAPSRKAALAAWGSDADLFARGVAEEVTDPALTAEPLARPGEVVKRSRGSAAEQFAALPPDRPRKAGRTGRTKKQAAAAKVAPKPSRAALDAAEEALDALDTRHAADERAIAARQAALERERRDLARRRSTERRALEQARDAADTAYRAALHEWRT